MEAAKKDVAVKTGWLESSIPNARHEGENKWPFPARSSVGTGRRSPPLDTS